MARARPAASVRAFAAAGRAGERADLRALSLCPASCLLPARAPAGRYQKRKYVWKMLYIYVLGYEVDFGHMEALNLITAQGYAEKTVGYLACVLLLSETNEFLRLVINSVKNDLASHNDEVQSLALACVANVGGREFAETLAPDVIYQVLRSDLI